MEKVSKNKTTYQSKEFKEYCEFLRWRTDYIRSGEGKAPYSDATIKTIARDTFYLERQEKGHDFMDWILGEKGLERAEKCLKIHLAHRRTPEADVKYYLHCMYMFYGYCVGIE